MPFFVVQTLLIHTLKNVFEPITKKICYIVSISYIPRKSLCQISRPRAMNSSNGPTTRNHESNISTRGQRTRSNFPTVDGRFESNAISMQVACRDGILQPVPKHSDQKRYKAILKSCIVLIKSCVVHNVLICLIPWPTVSLILE